MTQASLPQVLNRTTANKPFSFPVRVLQFGKGNFLRAFADVIFDKLNESGGFNGAITIAQVSSQITDARFSEQEGLFHVLENGLKKGELRREIRLITAVSPELLNPFADYNQFLEAGENPDLRYITSNTTEAGIRVDSGDKSPEALPSTFPGKLTSVLYRRFQHFGGDLNKGLIFLPCELIEENGNALRDAILQYARQWNLDAGFSTWISDHNLFCNSLVDRIVPGFPHGHRDRLWQESGFKDQLLVTAEPYALWLIEVGSGPKSLADELLATFSAVDDVVRFVDQLEPYRLRKVRILNGMHTTMVPVAYLRGLRTVREAVEDSYVGDFCRLCLDEEILPTLNFPREELARYASDVFERFRNPFIHHELKSIALNAIAKFRVRVLPSILAYYAIEGSLPDRLVQALAAWIVFYRGEWKGEPIPLSDEPEVIDFFATVWSSSDTVEIARRVLAHTPFWETDMTQLPGMVTAVARCLDEMIAWSAQDD